MCGGPGVGEGAHRIEVAEVQAPDLQVARYRPHEFLGLVALGHVPHRHSDRGSAAGQGLGGVEAKAGICAGHQSRAAGEVGHLGHGPALPVCVIVIR